MSVVIDEDDFEYETDNLDENAVYDVKIKVIGVGGGGCNAVEHMAKLYARDAEAILEKGGTPIQEHIEFIAMNTDVAALKNKEKTLMRRVQIGKKCCKGRGAGGRPEVAAEAAKESRDEIESLISGAAIVFIAAGMGGGTGTGAAPIVAEIAQELNIITVGVVTKPFEFEREHKMNQAMKGIDEMRKHVDALLIIPNERLLKLNEKMLGFRQAFSMVDDVLYRSVKIVSDIVTTANGTINTDFADLCTILANAGDAHIAIGTASGENKIKEAVSQVVNSPLLETSIANATKLLVNVTLSGDSSIRDLHDSISLITAAAAPEVEMIQGVNQNDELTDTISIAVIAAGFKTDTKKRPEVEISVNGSKVQTAPKSVSETIETTSSNDMLAKIITSTLGNLQEKERYAELEDIFRSRNRD